MTFLAADADAGNPGQDHKLISISDKHGNEIILDKDGITLDSAKDLKFKAAGNVTIEGAKVDVK